MDKKDHDDDFFPDETISSALLDSIEADYNANKQSRILRSSKKDAVIFGKDGNVKLKINREGTSNMRKRNVTIDSVKRKRVCEDDDDDDDSEDSDYVGDIQVIPEDVELTAKEIKKIPRMNQQLAKVTVKKLDQDLANVPVLDSKGQKRSLFQ
ncbi:hypothetical protein M5689_011084 [Euphorbia peplus]|nr:hypothetical protein M5689_011084 [Euphorbia peplus]